MAVLGPLKRLMNHPLNRPHPLRALGRVAWWQVRSRLARGGRKIAVPFIDHTRLLVRRGMFGATGCIYSGFEEPQEMGFALHFLRPGDRFVDVGANVGVYSVLAAGAAGADVIAFEPVAATLEHLRDNLALNGIASRVEFHPFAVGATAGSVRFTTQDDVMNRVALDGQTAGLIDVRQIALDEFLSTSSAVTLVKIDVEGFETRVIDGAERTLRDPVVAGVLIELVGEGKRYGFDEDALHRRLIDLGLRPCQYDAVTRELREGVAVDGWSAGRASIYLRDLDAARERVRSARQFRLINGPI